MVAGVAIAAATLIACSAWYVALHYPDCEHDGGASFCGALGGAPGKAVLFVPALIVVTGAFAARERQQWNPLVLACFVAAFAFSLLAGVILL